MKKIILASSSPRRTEILEMLGLPHTICSADIDETCFSYEKTEDCVSRLSCLKAETVSDRISGGIIIGSDTLVEAHNRDLKSEIFGKPINEEDAFRMLKILSGNRSIVYSGICLMDSITKRKEWGFSKTFVFMKSFDDQTILNYIKTGEPMDKAGAYAVQGKGAALIERIEGDFFNVVGLPVSLLVDMLKKFEIEIP